MFPSIFRGASRTRIVGRVCDFRAASTRTISKNKRASRVMAFTTRTAAIFFTTFVVGGGLLYILDTNGYVQPLPPTKTQSRILHERRKQEKVDERLEKVAAENADKLGELPFSNDATFAETIEDESAWGLFAARFKVFTSLGDRFPDVELGGVPDSITDFIIPDWARGLADGFSKLQKELSAAPGSLADEIWQEACDPGINPEISQQARVRISNDLCDEEKEFLSKRRSVTRLALARYLGLPLELIHPDDVPTIAMIGSGGGLRACVAGTGSMLAATEDGLFDCVTYTAGVSGSCWLQAIYNSSIGGRRFDKVVQHLKNRIGIHIANPPPAFALVNSAPTNKYLLTGFVEKLKGDPEATWGPVDLYGGILAARLMVPKSEVGVEKRDLKISTQREYIKHGENPMPIYTAVRHEIPIVEESSEVEKTTHSPSEETKEKARREAWFQWFEITPYEFYCDEFSAGIPTWALGRKFKNGEDVPREVDGLYQPEIKIPLLLGIFGSAFCATTWHYFREIRPIMVGLLGFGWMVEMIDGRNDDLKLVHPIEPAQVPNFAYGMEGKLSQETPKEIYENKHIQLMDAGMSNNLPIYPLLRPGRNVDVVIAFDASADIKTENWLSVVDGYAKQRGIKGWPLGAGWPAQEDTTAEIAQQLDEAQAQTSEEADEKIEEAKAEQAELQQDIAQGSSKQNSINAAVQDASDLSYCNVWVGSTTEREPTDATTSTPSLLAEADDWKLMEPDAGITVIYFPYVANPKVEGVDPVTSPCMSTWNFIYTPEDVDDAMELARTNFLEGKEQTRRTVRAVYERKKKIREERERAEKSERFRRKMRLGVIGKKGEGDHFS